ncbi:MAG: VWA domain-containing protein [Deltaproteobacteria bacterium]|nr:VWA domain-containing protein [Deltaproteobacteria bacterium]
MSWSHGELLWLLLGVPVIAALPFFASWWRQRAAARMGNAQSVQALIVGDARRLRAARAVMLTLGVTLVVLAMAGPQYGSRTRILRRRGVDVIIALDFSKSMLARDVRPSRIERAKAEVLRFVEELDGDRVGCVAFAGETIEFPMTVDYAALALFFRDLGPYDMPVGGTAIARALVSSKRLFERASTRDARQAEEQEGRPRSRVVVLLTDGEDHEGDPIAAARELAEAGIRVYTVGIGTSTGEPIPTYAPDGTWTGYQRDDAGNIVHTALTEEAEAQLREIAEITGGRYYAAGRGAVGIDQIRADIRRMHQDEQRSRRVTVQEGRYALFLVPGFLLLVLEALLPDAWIGALRRRRRPTAAEARKKGPKS